MVSMTVCFAFCVTGNCNDKTLGRTSGLPGAMNYLYTYLWGQAPTPLINDLNEQALW